MLKTEAADQDWVLDHPAHATHLGEAGDDFYIARNGKLEDLLFPLGQSVYIREIKTCPRITKIW